MNSAHTTASNLDVANEILRQLGGNRFVAMTGARHLLGGPKALQFKIGRGAKDGITNVQITLDPSDTYTVQFWRIHGTHMTLVRSVSDVYGDSLRTVFTCATGMHTSL